MTASPIHGAWFQPALRRKQLMWGSVLFHLGVLVIFAGHFVGLLTPIWVFDTLGISHEAKQILAIVAGGVAGVMAIIGATLLVHRRLFDPRIRASSRPTDTLIIILLWIQLLLGLATIPVSLQHLDGHEMVKFMSWAQGIFTFNSQASLRCRCIAYLQAAYRFGSDNPAAVPVYASRSYAERTCALYLASRLSGCAQAQ